MRVGKTRESSTRNAITLVDIGGTKELILVVGVDDTAELSEGKIYASHEFKAPTGSVKGFYDKTSKEIAATRKKAGEGVNVLPFVCVGTPGRFVSGVIQPGSAANLGDDNHEFDAVDPAKEIEKRLGVRVFLGNDAIAQMAHGLKTLLEKRKTRERLRASKVCYIGPGTGTGGGFCKVNEDLSLEFYTDGHIYDILVPGFEGKVAIPFTYDGRAFKANLPYEKTKLEDLLSGRAIRQIAAAMEREVLSQGLTPMFLPALPEFKSLRKKELLWIISHENKDSPLNARFLRETFLQFESPEKAVIKAKPTVRSLFEFEGIILGKLIECIFTGNITKLLETSQWSPKDKKKAAETRNYLIGGSVGTRGIGGKVIQDSALKYLKKKFPAAEFSLYPLIGETANAGAFGTYTFADKKQVLEKIGLS